MKRHPEHGFEALHEGGVSENVRQACLHHHERMDGMGCPHQQAGKAISLLARMTAVCDVYDAITSNRPYERGWDPADALSKMISWKGHFDPTVLSAFIEVVGIYPTDRWSGSNQKSWPSLSNKTSEATRGQRSGPFTAPHRHVRYRSH